ncbi:MAG: hypothetical protein CL912_18740 [Deltaproteobacteria bacterium]|nr:hypothetical protein [Deltaproteobacteria bacterium]|tara:strand:+ start:298 stop:705 length:408 start_codon:yes stop_codon:yes gene_type:complete
MILAYGPKRIVSERRMYICVDLGHRIIGGKRQIRARKWQAVLLFRVNKLGWEERQGVQLVNIDGGTIWTSKKEVSLLKNNEKVQNILLEHQVLGLAIVESDEELKCPVLCFQEIKGQARRKWFQNKYALEQTFYL